MQFGDKLRELLKGSVWAVTYGPPCISSRFICTNNNIVRYTILNMPYEKKQSTYYDFDNRNQRFYQYQNIEGSISQLKVTSQHFS